MIMGLRLPSAGALMASLDTSAAIGSPDREETLDG